jgi:hypothetical protein
MSFCSLPSRAVCWRKGDLLLEDRGFLDGEMLPYVKQERKADAIHPLRANMAATIDAIAVAEMEKKWPPHPTRAQQHIAFVAGVDEMWEECQVRLHACVIKYYEKKGKEYKHIVLVTTDVSLSAKWIVSSWRNNGPDCRRDAERNCEL